MKKTLRLFVAFVVAAGMISGAPVQAAVSLTAGPASLVTSPVYLKGSSAPLPLFEVALSASAGETLSGLTILVNQTGTSTVNSSDFSNLSLYKDNGDAVFSGADTVVASPAAVNVGTTTALSLASTSTPATGKFFVVLTTSSSWGDASPAERITVTMPANAISTSAGSVASAAVTTAVIIGDNVRPNLVSATAKNTGGTEAKEAGDSVELVFSEPTNKAAVTSSNINALFTLGGGHSFLNASGTLGGAVWDEAGMKLTIVLAGSASTGTLPTAAPGDSVAVTGNSALTDLAGNLAQGSINIIGSFGGQGTDSDNGDENVTGTCANTLINGRLYKIGNEPTVYLAAACRLKPFRGNAVFKARGQKFQNLVILPAKPADVTISEKPVLPAAGTLVKGSDRTVWFVTKNGDRRGFVSGEHFLALGFRFDKVMTISDSDLALVPPAAPIENNENHPDGALVKCSNSAAVYQVIGKVKFPFASSQSFTGKGHTFEHVLVVDCAQYSYPTGAPISQ